MAGELDSIKIDCGRTLDIGTAAGLYREIVQALAQEGPLLLDLSSVSLFDTAGMQLLWMASAAAKAEGRELHFERPCAELCQAIGVLDLGGRLSGWPETGWPETTADESGE